MKKVVILFIIVLGTVMNILVKSDTIPLAFSADEYLNQADPELSENELEQLERGEEITKTVRHLFFDFIPVVLFYDKHYKMKGNLIYRYEKVNFCLSFIRLLILLPILVLLIFGIFFLFGYGLSKYRLLGTLLSSVGLLCVLILVALLFYFHVSIKLWDLFDIPTVLGIFSSVYIIYKNKKEGRYLTV